MTKLWDKLLIIGCCIIALFLGSLDYNAISCLAAAVIVSCVCVAAKNRKIKFFLIPAFGLGCAVEPALLCCAPLVFYDALWEDIRWSAIFLPAVGVNAVSISGMSLAAVIFGFMTAFLLFQRSCVIYKLKYELVNMRDSSAETQFQLEAKNRRLYENQYYEVRLATLKERNRIAREIHDSVGHMLTRSILQVGALLIINKDSDQKEALESLKDTLNNAMTSIRQSVHDLRDNSVNLQLVTVEALKAFEEKYTVNFEYDCGEDMPAEVKFCFVGIIKESLANIVKHSSADSLSLTIREHPAFYQLVIQDNGDCGELNDSGMGLSNMKQRAETVGGRISFTPSKEGFKVFLTVSKTKNAG